MASLLPTEIASIVASAFKGKLVTGTLRRDVAAGVDAKGDPVPASAVTYTVEGIRDNFSAYYMSVNGINQTDVRILLIMNLIKPATTPLKDDQIYMYGEWYKVRRIVEVDPARASITMACFRMNVAPV